MGKMKDLVIDNLNIKREWSAFLIDLLEQLGMGQVQEKEFSVTTSREDYEAVRFLPDISLSQPSAQKPTAIELKVYRWRKDWVSHFRAAADHLLSVIRNGDYAGGILVVTLDIERANESDFFSDAAFPVEIWDLGRLRRLVQGNKSLEAALEDLVSATLLDDDRFNWSEYALHDHLPEKSSPADQGGLGISRKLRSTEAGAVGWREFEKHCETALRYLFRDDISAWKTQKRTDDKLNRMDLIGRINVGSRSFWSVIEQDFRTRYVVFEAKNYADPITQGAVYTTEKYLFTKSLRSFALIIARNGCDDGAKKAVSGALREQGKLILVVTLNELCLMLEQSDQGDAPENLLYQKMDDLLMSVGR